MSKPDADLLLEQVAEITAAYVANNPIAPADLPALITSIHQSPAGLTEPEPPAEEYAPAVSVRASLKPDHLVCLECGAKQKSLKRHLMAAHELTPEQYRERYGLKPDYPMVAPSYSKQRSKLAMQMGLGRKRTKRK